MVKKRRLRNLRCVGRSRIMRPHRFESVVLSHKCFQGESRRMEKGQGQASPLFCLMSLSFTGWRQIFPSPQGSSIS